MISVGLASPARKVYRATFAFVKHYNKKVRGIRLLPFYHSVLPHCVRKGHSLLTSKNCHYCTFSGLGTSLI